MEHLVEQLVLVAKALDTDYEAMRQQVESTPPRKPADSERTAETLQHTRGVMGRNSAPIDANCPKNATTRQEDRRRINSLQTE